MTKFSQYNFNDAINKSLKEIHFEEPTKVQEAVISLVNKKKDIIEVTGMSNQTYCKSIKSLKNKLISIGIMPASMMAASV